MNEILAALTERYKIFAPRRFEGQGSGNRSYVVRYGQIDTVAEIVADEQSDFSPKEIYHPIIQTLLHLSDSECVESRVEEERDYLLLLRPCDSHGMHRLDTVFLGNGGREDLYYKRLREKVKVFLLECGGGWDGCFCTAMGTNAAEDYSVAVGLAADGVRVQVRDPAFRQAFAAEREVDYSPAFTQQNETTVALPAIVDRGLVKPIAELPYWKQFDDTCISCGGCNTVCPTCSCFDTVDVLYNEQSLVGERRRVWSSCMLEGFSVMAGGHGVRGTPGERMRFKIMHKVFDYRYRFGGGHMCVGCGRCDRRCPRDIRFSSTVSGLAAEVEKLAREENLRQEVASNG